MKTNNNQRKVKIIAEVHPQFMGSMNELERMIIQCKANGADYVKADLSAVKLILTAFAFAGLFIVTIVSTIFMNVGGGVTISSVTLDGDNDEIDLLKTTKSIYKIHIYYFKF